MERTRIHDRSSNEDTRRKVSEDTEFGAKKTILVLAIVAACFAVLWPKIFYPMLTGPVNSIHTPVDSSVCCDLIFESDVNTADILQEMCKNILRHHQVDPRVRDALKTNKLSPQSASFCREEVLARCGIDMSSYLAQKERLGKSHKQVLEEIRSFNSSICLKNFFGVSFSQLGIPHLIRYHILMPHTPIKQERRLPPHAGGLHPAMRERGRAIPASHIVPKVEGRPDHVIPKIRPPMGGAGRVMPPQGGGGSSMGIIMPLYTIGILLFFLYTIAKVLKKNTNNEIYQDYRNVEAEREFRDRVFNPEILSSAITGTHYSRKDKSPSPPRPIPTIEELKAQAAGDIEVDRLIQRLADTEAAMERIVLQMGSLSRTNIQNPCSETAETKEEFMDKNCCQNGHNGIEELDDLSSTVKVMGMEMTASCEGGQKISRPTTPIIPHSHNHAEREKTPPKPIYLEGSLPSQCELLVTDSETQAESSEENSEPAVVLSGKMTLSLINHDQNSAGPQEMNGNVEVPDNTIVDPEIKDAWKENRESNAVLTKEKEVQEEEISEDEEEVSEDEEAEEKEEEEVSEEEEEEEDEDEHEEETDEEEQEKEKEEEVEEEEEEDEEEEEEEEEGEEEEEEEEEEEDEEDEEEEEEEDEQKGNRAIEIDAAMKFKDTALRKKQNRSDDEQSISDYQEFGVEIEEKTDESESEGSSS